VWHVIWVASCTGLYHDCQSGCDVCGSSEAWVAVYSVIRACDGEKGIDGTDFLEGSSGSKFDAIV
jgi:hypothetical protein